jgi:hypothetical protein
VEIPAGSTIPNIAAAPRMVTEVPRTSLAVRRVETRFPIGRLVQGNRLAGRAEIWPALAVEELAGAIELTEPELATVVVVWALTTGRGAAERIE